MIKNHLLTITLFLPVFGAAFLLFIDKEKEKLIKNSALAFSLITFLLSLPLFFLFPAGDAGFSFAEKYSWIKPLGIHYSVGIDGLSLMMTLLTTFLMPICVLSSYDYIKTGIKQYYAWLLFLETGIIGVFVSLDVFLFYVFWEAMLIPMYFLIGVWGGERRIYATLKFFIYTMAGSLFMLVAILILFYAGKQQHGIYSFDLLDFYKVTLTGKLALFSFLAFLAAFAVKVPIFPFHTWLPDAHVEAPTAGSVILAGVLLKMGIYGYLRFLVPIFPELSVEYAPWIAGFGVIGVIYASLVAWAQKDIKKLIAYSSIAHLGLVILGVMSFTPEAVSGGILQMVNHGLSTGALFLLAGILYERRHTRHIASYGGLFKSVPHFAAVFMVAALSSIALPGLNGFVGEFMIFAGSFGKFPLLTSVAISGVILSAVYMLSMYEKVFYGELSIKENENIPDLKTREWLYLLPILFFIV
ncbi:MAG: Fe-S-binding domain-containing protein, partial [Elusimicrobia bacterium CG08_land_8_20_14_0_20_51_18]